MNGKTKQVGVSVAAIRLLAVVAVLATVLVVTLVTSPAAISGQERPAGGEGRPLPHAGNGKEAPGKELLKHYAGRWRVESARQHTGQEAVVEWKPVAGGAAMAFDLTFETPEGKVSASAALIVHNPATGVLEVIGSGGDGAINKGVIYADGLKHEWVWDGISWVAGEGDAPRRAAVNNFKQVITFSEDGKSYHCIAHVRRGMDWAKAFESKFVRIEEE